MTGFSDPAAFANRSVPAHRWAPWIAGYSQPFGADAINRYAVPGCTVLDPFAGVGTTLLGADFAGYDAVGFEIGPYAALAARVKLNALKMGPPFLRAAKQEIEKCTAKAIGQETLPKTMSALARVRQRRADDPAYGGPGWTNYTTQYFSDCARFIRAVRRALTPEGRAGCDWKRHFMNQFPRFNPLGCRALAENIGGLSDVRRRMESWSMDARECG